MLAQPGVKVDVYDGKATFGRKFLLNAAKQPRQTRITPASRLPAAKPRVQLRSNNHSQRPAHNLLPCRNCNPISLWWPRKHAQEYDCLVQYFNYGEALSSYKTERSQDDKVDGGRIRYI